MPYGICHLSIVPVRIQPDDTSEMVSQVLFGEHFEVLEKRKNWSRIRLAYDGYEGWIDAKQFQEIDEMTYHTFEKSGRAVCAELLDFVSDDQGQLHTISMGASLPGYRQKKLVIAGKTFHYEGTVFNKKLPKSELIKNGYTYLNTPYLWGGRSPFGIDCSGFTQMVYKLCGYKLLRDAAQQATQGKSLSFIEESEPGDLAFFDNQEGTITHVGMIMKDHYIIHAHGQVRIDRIDHSGIFNTDLNRHTHRLRVIKKII